jgi:hypothetical protein
MHGLRLFALGALAVTCIGCASRGSYLKSGPGPEDLEVIRINGRDAIVTGTGRRPIWPGRSDPNGEIQVLYPGSDSEFKTLFKGNLSDTFAFQPAGICYVPRPEKHEGPLLYATNHAGRSIEIFQVGDGKLIHLDRLKIEMEPGRPILKKTAANAVVAFPDGWVYATIFAIFPKWCGSQVRAAGPESKEKGNIVIAYNPNTKQWRRALVGFNGCNGLAAGPGGRSLLVAELHSKRILSFGRNPETGELQGDPTPLNLDLNFYPDNIKRTAESVYEISGSRSTFLSGLDLATNIPCSPGGWVSVTWDGQRISSRDNGWLLAGHNHSPSTTITFGDHLYSAQPKCSGVFVAPLR